MCSSSQQKLWAATFACRAQLLRLLCQWPKQVLRHHCTRQQTLRRNAECSVPDRPSGLAALEDRLDPGDQEVLAHRLRLDPGDLVHRRVRLDPGDQEVLAHQRVRLGRAALVVQRHSR